MEPKKKDAATKSIVSAVIYAATYLPATWLLKNQVFGQSVSIAIVIVPIIAFSVFIFYYIKAIAVMDEIRQRIQLEAVVIGFSLTALLAMLLFLLGLCNISIQNWFGYGHLVAYCWLFYFIGWLISKRKYGV